MKNLSQVNLSALRAFEAVARLGSLAAAASELGVTPGAVSQQVIKAEAQLGQMLFERRPKGMVATDLGREVAAHLSDGFAALSRGVALTQLGSENAITISVAPVFAAKWLVRRLGRFAERRPDVQVRIDASGAHVTPEYGNVDACIRVGRGDWPGVTAEEILPQRVLPVCAPAVAETVTELSDLAGLPIIREQANGLFGWEVWLSPNGEPESLLGDGPVFSDASLCLDAAMAGQGVFLALEALAEDGLSMGQLKPALLGRFPAGVSYWFVEPKTGRRPAQVQAFRDWIFEELRPAKRL
ncbi:MAG: LysR substrate-binding domain-containing protein [Litoreibacter sp.]|nr:LysR substrate-binding domain-containing protein [Litoreibacter sp.]MCY4334929.1 LysR substrate-binding domain-containing protein [Litoreibacter sp.]